MNREEQLIAILEQIQSDLADLQSSGEADTLTNFTEIGKFYDRMCANITDFEDLIENSFTTQK